MTDKDSFTFLDGDAYLSKYKVWKWKGKEYKITALTMRTIGSIVAIQQKIPDAKDGLETMELLIDLGHTVIIQDTPDFDRELLRDGPIEELNKLIEFAQSKAKEAKSFLDEGHGATTKSKKKKKEEAISD